VRADGRVVRRYLAVPAPRYPQYRVALTAWQALLGRRGAFDLVHLHTPGFVGLSGWLAARRWKVPVVGTYHTDLTGMLRGSGVTPISRAFYRAWAKFSLDLCRQCDLATAPSESAASGLPDRRRAHRWAPIRIIPNGVDTERFCPDPGSTGPDRTGQIVFLGRLTRDKGVHRFLDAIERLDLALPWTASIVGEGPERAAVEQRIRNLPGREGRIRFLGPWPESSKPALLAATEVFVLPSLSDTSSIALLEALACGAAGVVTDRGGPAEIARASEGGLVVDPLDPAALAQAIERLLGDRRLCRAMAARGRAWVVAHGSAERMAREFAEVYDQLCRVSGPTSGQGIQVPATARSTGPGAARISPRR
jgi:glycosyltransferase involved in cell wall biosynthesis